MPEDPATYPILKHAMDHARSCAADLTEPEEDILPVLLWVGPYGMGIMPLLEMGDDDAKDAIAAMMTTVIATGRAAQAVLITTSWMVSAPRDEDGKPKKSAMDAMGGVMPSQHPDRIEAVTAMYASLAGTDSMSHAVLTRYPDKPPTMGEWEGIDEPMSAKIGGRFGDAIHMGMDLATQMPPEMIEILDAGWKQGEQNDLIERFHKVLTGIVPEIETQILGPDA